MTTGAEDKDAFPRALAGLLRPLVRALIAQGVTAPAFYRLIKQLYVEVAEEEFAHGADRQTDSRISMLTGVHRRDVKTYRDPDLTAARAAEEKVTTIATLLARWTAINIDANGAPKALTRAEFEDLARAVNQDIRPRTMLDELERQNLARWEGDRLHLIRDAFLGPADLEQKVYFFAENVGDHLAAAVENLLSDKPPFMERAVFYNRLRPASVDEIEAKAREAGAALLVELNKDALERQTEDAPEPEATERFRFGVFFYREGADD
ncbi:MAG: DUF6502 family protein [Pseudomonadota bacterium]